MKKHLKTINKLYDKGIVDDEYVYSRKNAFYNHIKNTNESPNLKVSTIRQNSKKVPKIQEKCQKQQNML